jgi:hypothetical protein
MKETLVAPNFFNLGPNSEHIDTNVLSDFIQKAHFVHRSVNMFSMIFGTSVTVPESEREPWRKIFAEQFVYPPPDSHPLSQNYKAPQTPPPPSGELSPQEYVPPEDA